MDSGGIRETNTRRFTIDKPTERQSLRPQREGIEGTAVASTITVGNQVSTALRAMHYICNFPVRTRLEMRCIANHIANHRVRPPTIAQVHKANRRVRQPYLTIGLPCRRALTGPSFQVVPSARVTKVNVIAFTLIHKRTINHHPVQKETRDIDPTAS
jgi:hypothetical protein